MTRQLKPILHARDHMPGGADPLLPSAAGPIAPTILATVPGAYYKVPETSGGWADSSGAGRHAAYHDPTAVAGASAPERGVPAPLDEGDGSLCVTVNGPAAGSALDSSDVGRVTNSFFDFDGHSPFTVSAVIRPRALPASTHISFSWGVCGEMSGQWGLVIFSGQYDPDTGGAGDGVTGKPGFYRQSAGDWHAAYAQIPLTVGEWVRLTGVYDGTESFLYVDDVAATGTVGSPPNPSLVSPVLPGFQFGSAWNHEGFGGTYGPFQGELDSVIVWDRALTPAEVGGIVEAGRTGTSDLVLGINDDGTVGWVQPKVDVTVNGETPAGPSTTPPPANPVVTPPPSGGPDGLSWIYDQPFLYGGTSFDVEPNRWTTIPFTNVIMVRYSNQTSRGGTCDIEIDPADPSAAGWVDPADPHAITVPHDFPIFADGFSWIQVCLRLESPSVEPTTSYRQLRVFETTQQKSVLRSGQFRVSCCVEHGATSVYRDPTAAGWTPPPDGTDTFAEGDDGGLDNGNHDRIMFAPNSGYGWRIEGDAWLPRNTLGALVLTEGMRLVAQVWHDASHTLTFEAGGTTPSFGSPAHAPYRPHFCVFQSAPRSWGSPWSDWPTFP